MVITRERIAEVLAKALLRYQRGNALCNVFIDILQITAYIGIIGLVIERMLGFQIDPQIILTFAPVVVIIFYVIGHIDEKVGFWKIEQAYVSKELNPFLREMSDNIKEIKENVKND